MKKRIAIFASGNGSNAEAIVRYFQSTGTAEVVLVIANRSEAQVLERAQRLHVPSVSIPSSEFRQPERLMPLLEQYRVDWIVLAGFLLMIPDYLVKAYARKMVNIHPALLPKFGGKGMYGMNVHRAVVEQGERETGITIHFVDEHYDEGEVIFQAKCEVLPTDTPEMVAQKVHQLEYRYYPSVIESIL